jgi:hypothetical protein
VLPSPLLPPDRPELLLLPVLVLVLLVLVLVQLVLLLLPLMLLPCCRCRSWPYAHPCVGWSPLAVLPLLPPQSLPPSAEVLLLLVLAPPMEVLESAAVALPPVCCWR